METVVRILKNSWLTITGVIIGSAGGFLYWSFIGCASGSCPITSSPLMSTIWGGIIGGLLFSMFKKNRQNRIK